MSKKLRESKKPLTRFRQGRVEGRPSMQLLRGLCAQRFAATRTARVQNLAACFGRHTRTKAMTALAHEVRWLKSPFRHRLAPVCWSVRRAARKDHDQKNPYKVCAIRKAARRVNKCARLIALLCKFIVMRAILRMISAGRYNFADKHLFVTLRAMRENHVFNTLSGRFLILTLCFVMLAEVLIFVPSVARFREDYLLSRLERAQIASLALLANDGMVDNALEDELLRNAEVLNVVLRRDEVRELVLSAPEIPPIAATYDLRAPAQFDLIRDAMMQLGNRTERTIRVIGAPVRDAGLEIEVTMHSAPLRAAMIDFGLRILVLSAVISAFTATLLFVSVRYFLVTPMNRLVGQVRAYADAPEDARRIITPNAGLHELRDAEMALNKMQTELTAALRQKDHLAQMGAAVAKISHDLRNILTTASLMADRLEIIDDPTVKRTAPKLLQSLARAVNLCEGTLAFGRAQEPPPALARVDAASLLRDVVESEALGPDGEAIRFDLDVEAGLTLRCDAEQMFRVLGNLIRNARQAILAQSKSGVITIAARANARADGWEIRVSDTGPGLPEKAREHLFKPFQGGARKGGSGLGLAIAAELVRGHGGSLTLERSDAQGTEFKIWLPSHPLG